MTTRPSRFHATPAEIDAFLRQHFAEDVLLRYQQALGWRVVSEAAADQRMQANWQSVNGTQLPDFVQHIWNEAADHIDPLRAGGPFPSKMITFGS
jgi:hypothetical protein